jgi:hypothetical protein
MDGKQIDHLSNLHHQSMIKVNKSLSKLKETVSVWPALPGDDLEPQHRLMVKHLKDMHCCLENLQLGANKQWQ